MEKENYVWLTSSEVNTYMLSGREGKLLDKSIYS